MRMCDIFFQSNCPHGCPCENYDCENNESDSSLHFEKIGPFNASLNNKIGEITKYYNNFEFSMELKYGSIQERRQMLEGIVFEIIHECRNNHEFTLIFKHVKSRIPWFMTL